MAYFAAFPLSVIVTDNVLPAAALFFFDFPHAETASTATSAATTTTSHLDPVFKFILLKGGWDGGRLAGACRYAHPVADREDRGHPVLVGDQLGVQGPGRRGRAPASPRARGRAARPCAGWNSRSPCPPRAPPGPSPGTAPPAGGRSPSARSAPRPARPGPPSRPSPVPARAAAR